MTKKEIVKQIAEQIGLTQLQTKEIVQQTFDAIVKTLLEVGRIELRNFGVFEVKQRKARKARNPRTGTKVDVPPKYVVTFKPGKEMEERVRQMKHLPSPSAAHLAEDDEDDAVIRTKEKKPAKATAGASNGTGQHDGVAKKKVPTKPRKTS